MRPARKRRSGSAGVTGPGGGGTPAERDGTPPRSPYQRVDSKLVAPATEASLGIRANAAGSA
jgi:hypothetical protein